MNLTDQFLLAMPTLVDTGFHQTLSYICEHNENGAMGLMINRTVDLELGDIFDQMSIESADLELVHQPVYSGGPVDPERGFVLHDSPGDWEATMQVGKDIRITSSRDILQDIALGKGPQRSLIILGYSGWAPGQLEQEISENSWLTSPSNKKIIFSMGAEKKLAAAAALMGIDLVQLSSSSGHA